MEHALTAAEVTCAIAGLRAALDVDDAGTRSTAHATLGWTHNQSLLPGQSGNKPIAAHNHQADISPLSSWPL